MKQDRQNSPPSIWWRIISGIVAVFLLCVSPYALILSGFCFFGHGSAPVMFREKIIGAFYLLIPFSSLLFIWFTIGAPRFRHIRCRFSLFYRDSGDDGYKLLEHASHLERRGRVQEALELYQEIAAKYSHTTAGQDALVSIKTLRAQI